MLKNKLLLLFFVLPFSCLTQDLQTNVQFFSVNDGLSGRAVFSVQQDERGLIWVGTDNGLNRFDGQNFKTMGEMNKDLSYGKIEGIKKDKAGKFWIYKRESDIILFDPITETTELIADRGKDPEGLELLFPQGNGSLIYFRDPEEKIFYLNEKEKIVPFGDVKIPNQYNVIPTGWNTILINQSLSPKLIEVGPEGDTSRIIMNKHGFLNVYHKTDNLLRFLNNNKEEPIGSLDFLKSIDKTGSLKPIKFTKNNKPLHYKDLGLLTEEEYYHYVRMTKDSHGNTWLMINEKLWLFDQHGDFKLNLTDKLSSYINDKRLVPSHLFVDKEDRLWVSTELGLFLIQIKPNLFDHYLVNNNQHSVRGIMEVSDNKLLIISYGGTQLLDKTTKAPIKEYPIHGLALSKGKGDTILCGTHSNYYLKFYDNKFSKFGKSSFDKDYMRSNLLHFDKNSDQYFIGTSFGLFFLKNDSIQIYSKLNDFKDLNEFNISSFHQNEDGIWVGTYNGLYLLNSDKGVIDHVQFPTREIKYIHEDEHGDLWLATEGGGLIHWDRKKNKVRQLTTKNGLSHNVIYAVYQDNNGYLWLPSKDGLMRFNKKNDEVIVFNTNDGLSHQEFNTFSHYQAEDGRLYFGGLNGVNAFYPDKINLEENSAPFILTQVQQYDNSQEQLVDNTRQYSQESEIKLSPGDKFFNLSFSLLDYGAEQHSYAWKIVGLDEEWTYQKENTLRINGLPYGKYNLQIKAKGEGGKWAKQELNIPIHVIEPFYKSTIFYFLCGIFSVIGVLLFYIIRVRRLEKRQVQLEAEITKRTEKISKQNIQLEKLNANKDQFFSIIGHDLRGPLLSLRGISKKVNFLIQNDRIEEVHQLGESIEQSTQRVTKLLDNLLNWAMVQKGQFPYHPDQVSIYLVVEEVCDIYKTVAELNNIDIQIKVPSHHRVFCDKNAISTVVRNLIDNALKFTQKHGKIIIESSIKSQHIELRISDTGVGMSPATLDQAFKFEANERNKKQGTGLGLILCKDLIHLNKGKIAINSEVGKGTEFTIEIPNTIQV